MPYGVAGKLMPTDFQADLKGRDLWPDELVNLCGLFCWESEGIRFSARAGRLQRRQKCAGVRETPCWQITNTDAYAKVICGVIEG